jgi:hypothetical protein
MSSLKPIAALNAAGYHPVATDGSSLTNIMAVTLVGPAAHRSCNILWVDYNTVVPISQRDGSISYPYLTVAEALTYIGTQPAASAWEIIAGPGTEPADLAIPAGYSLFFVGHYADVTILPNITQTVDLPYTSTLSFKNITVGDISVVDGGSPNGLIVYAENAKRGALTQTGTSLVSVVDSSTIDEAFPVMFPPAGVVQGDTVITGTISGTNVIYDPGCNNLNGQAVYLSGTSIQAATITVAETAIIKDTQWGFYNPQIIKNAGDFPIEVFLDAPSTISWNDKVGIAPVNTFVTTDFGTANERYSCNQQDRYYFGRQSVVQFRTDWNSPLATWGYLGSPPTRGASFTTGVPAEARASVTQRKDWLLVQPSYDGTGLFLGSKQLLHPPGSVISVELGEFSMDSYSQSPFIGTDVLYWMFSQQASGDIDLDNFVLFQLLRTAVDTWIVGMIVRYSGSVIYSNSNTIIADTCPASYAQISQNGSVVQVLYSKDRNSWKQVGNYDLVLTPLALDRTSIFVQAGQGPNTIFGFKEFNTYLSPTI